MEQEDFRKGGGVSVERRRGEVEEREKKNAMASIDRFDVDYLSLCPFPFLLLTIPIATSPGCQQGVLADLRDVIEHEAPQASIHGGVEDCPQSSDIGVVAAANAGADRPRGVARRAAGSQLRGERLEGALSRRGPCAREVSRRGGGEAAQGLEAIG